MLKETAIDLAKDSVPRLKSAELCDGELVKILKILVSERLHPINKILAEITEMEWYGEEDQWEGYKQLLCEMIKIIEKYHK